MFYEYARLLISLADSIYEKEAAGVLFALAVHFREVDDQAVEDWEGMRSVTTHLDDFRGRVAALAACGDDQAALLFTAVGRLTRRDAGGMPAGDSTVLRYELLRRVRWLLGEEAEGPHPMAGLRAWAATREPLARAVLVAYLLDLRRYGDASMSEKERALFLQVFVASMAAAAFRSEIFRAAELVWRAATYEALERHGGEAGRSEPSSDD